MRRPPRLATALFAGVAILGFGLAAMPLSADAAPLVTSAAAAKPELTVAPRDGGVVESGGSLSMVVSITNAGNGTLAAGSLYMSIDPLAVTSTATLAAHIANPSTDSVIVGRATATPIIPPGGERDVRVTLSASSLESLFGATPVAGARVVTAQLRSGGATTAVAAAAFTVVGAGFTSPVSVGTIVPITAPATRSGLLSAGQLSDLTGEFGAWTEALEAVEGTTAVIALDPMVIASITTKGTAAPQSARDFLTELQELPNESFALPYGDSDLALEQAGGATSALGVASFAGNVDAANFVGLPTPTPTDTLPADPAASATPTPTPSATSSIAGVPTTDQLLAWPYTSTSIGWPAAGSVSAKTLAFDKRSKLTTTLLSSADVNDSVARRAAGPLATVSGSQALIGDATLSSLLATASGPETGKTRAALSQLVATLAIDASTGSAPTVLMTASRVDQDSTTLTHVLTELSTQTWIHSTGLATMLTQKTRPAVSLKKESVAAARASSAKSMLTADAHVRELGEAVDPVDTLVGPTRLELLAMLSNAWHGDPSWPTAAAATADSLETTASKQVTIRESPVNILGDVDAVPVTVVNNLDQAVTVVVSGSPSNPKMTISPSKTTTIPAGGVARVSLPVRVISNGQVRLGLMLSTPQGWKLGDTKTVTVTLNAGWETIGAVVVSGALLLLFGTGVYRNLTKRRRALKRSAARRAAREQAER